MRAGAKVGLFHGHGCSVLHYAVEGAPLQLVKNVISVGADLNNE